MTKHFMALSRRILQARAARLMDARELLALVAGGEILQAARRRHYSQREALRCSSEQKAMGSLARIAAMKQEIPSGGMLEDAIMRAIVRTSTREARAALQSLCGLEPGSLLALEAGEPGGAGASSHPLTDPAAVVALAMLQRATPGPLPRTSVLSSYEVLILGERAGFRALLDKAAAGGRASVADIRSLSADLLADYELARNLFARLIDALRAAAAVESGSLMRSPRGGGGASIGSLSGRSPQGQMYAGHGLSSSASVFDDAASSVGSIGSGDWDDASVMSGGYEFPGSSSSVGNGTFDGPDGNGSMGSGSGLGSASPGRADPGNGWTGHSFSHSHSPGHSYGHSHGHGHGHHDTWGAGPAGAPGAAALSPRRDERAGAAATGAGSGPGSGYRSGSAAAAAAAVSSHMAALSPGGSLVAPFSVLGTGPSVDEYGQRKHMPQPHGHGHGQGYSQGYGHGHGPAETAHGQFHTASPTPAHAHGMGSGAAHNSMAAMPAFSHEISAMALQRRQVDSWPSSAAMAGGVGGGSGATPAAGGAAAGASAPLPHLQLFQGMSAAMHQPLSPQHHWQGHAHGHEYGHGGSMHSFSYGQAQQAPGGGFPAASASSPTMLLSPRGSGASTGMGMGMLPFGFAPATPSVSGSAMASMTGGIFTPPGAMGIAAGTGTHVGLAGYGSFSSAGAAGSSSSIGSGSHGVATGFASYGPGALGSGAAFSGGGAGGGGFGGFSASSFGGSRGGSGGMSGFVGGGASVTAGSSTLSAGTLSGGGSSLSPHVSLASAGTLSGGDKAHQTHAPGAGAGASASASGAGAAHSADMLPGATHGDGDVHDAHADEEEADEDYTEDWEEDRGTDEGADSRSYSSRFTGGSAGGAGSGTASPDRLSRLGTRTGRNRGSAGTRGSAGPRTGGRRWPGMPPLSGTSAPAGSGASAAFPSDGLGTASAISSSAAASANVGAAGKERGGFDTPAAPVMSAGSFRSTGSAPAGAFAGAGSAAALASDTLSIASDGRGSHGASLRKPDADQSRHDDADADDASSTLVHTSIGTFRVPRNTLSRQDSGSSSTGADAGAGAYSDARGGTAGFAGSTSGSALPSPGRASSSSSSSALLAGFRLGTAGATSGGAVDSGAGAADFLFSSSGGGGGGGISRGTARSLGPLTPGGGAGARTSTAASSFSSFSPRAATAGWAGLPGVLGPDPADSTTDAGGVATAHATAQRRVADIASAAMGNAVSVASQSLVHLRMAGPRTDAGAIRRMNDSWDAALAARHSTPWLARLARVVCAGKALRWYRQMKVRGRCAELRAPGFNGAPCAGDRLVALLFGPSAVPATAGGAGDGYGSGAGAGSAAGGGAGDGASSSPTPRESLAYKRRLVALTVIQRFARCVPAMRQRRRAAESAAHVSRRRGRALLAAELALDSGVLAPQLETLLGLIAQASQVSSRTERAATIALADGARDAELASRRARAQAMDTPLNADWITLSKPDDPTGPPTCYINLRSGRRLTEHPQTATAARAAKEAAAAATADAEARAADIRRQGEASRIAIAKQQVEAAHALYRTRMLAVTMEEETMEEARQAARNAPLTMTQSSSLSGGSSTGSGRTGTARSTGAKAGGSGSGSSSSQTFGRVPLGVWPMPRGTTVVGTLVPAVAGSAALTAFSIAAQEALSPLSPTGLPGSSASASASGAGAGAGAAGPGAPLAGSFGDSLDSGGSILSVTGGAGSAAVGRLQTHIRRHAAALMARAVEYSGDPIDVGVSPRR